MQLIVCTGGGAGEDEKMQTDTFYRIFPVHSVTPSSCQVECRGVNSRGSSVIGWHTHTGTACGTLQAAEAGLGIAFGSSPVMFSLALHISLKESFN